MTTTWKEFRNELNISKEDENIITLEKELIKALVNLREEKGLTQSQLAELCDVTQPVIARMESSIHSPQVNSLLKILSQLGYTLEIVPINSKQKI
jgi:transcriptional regulator with XRE-family HTH domain